VTACGAAVVDEKNDELVVSEVTSSRVRRVERR
jgi:hypothetical protein